MTARDHFPYHKSEMLVSTKVPSVQEPPRLFRPLIFNFPNSRLIKSLNEPCQASQASKLFDSDADSSTPKFSSVLHTPIHVCIVLYLNLAGSVASRFHGRKFPLLACERAQPRVNRLVPHWRRPNHGVRDELGSGRLGNLWNRGINGLPVTACTMAPDSASRGS